MIAASAAYLNIVVERTAHPTCFFSCQACLQVGRRSPRALNSPLGSGE
jgi:hypothetical protein